MPTLLLSCVSLAPASFSLSARPLDGATPCSRQCRLCGLSHKIWTPRTNLAAKSVPYVPQMNPYVMKNMDPHWKLSLSLEFVFTCQVVFKGLNNIILIWVKGSLKRLLQNIAGSNCRESMGWIIVIPLSLIANIVDSAAGHDNLLGYCPQQMGRRQFSTVRPDAPPHAWLWLYIVFTVIQGMILLNPYYYCIPAVKRVIMSVACKEVAWCT